MEKVRVLIADRQELAVAGIRHILAGSPRFEVIGETEGAELGQLITQLAPHILVLDYDHIPDFLPENILKLSQQHPALKLVVITDTAHPNSPAGNGAEYSGSYP